MEKVMNSDQYALSTVPDLSADPANSDLNADPANSDLSAVPTNPDPSAVLGANFPAYPSLGPQIQHYFNR
jgi:hypothetical protein